MIQDATTQRNFPFLSRLTVDYQIDLHSRDPELLGYNRAVDSPALDKYARHDATKNDVATVASVVSNAQRMAQWISSLGFTPRFYKALPLPSHYNEIRQDPELFYEQVVDPIRVLLRSLPIIDTPHYFNSEWYDDFDKFEGSIIEVVRETANLSDKLDRRIACWLWVDRYRDEAHLYRHIKILRLLRLSCVLWGTQEKPASVEIEGRIKELI